MASSQNGPEEIVPRLATRAAKMGLDFRLVLRSISKTTTCSKIVTKLLVNDCNLALEINRCFPQKNGVLYAKQYIRYELIHPILKKTFFDQEGFVPF